MDVMVKTVKGMHINQEALPNAINYIMRGVNKLPKKERLYGYSGIYNSGSIEEVIQEMMATKRIMQQEDGVQCKHFVISFRSKPKLDRKKLIRKIERSVGFWKRRFQLFWGVHCVSDKNGDDNWHVHLVLNSVDMVNGKKIDISGKLIRKFKKEIKDLWADVA